MSVLNIRDENGKFIPIPSIRGESGKSAYEQAKEGGFIGTEQEFIAILNGLTSDARPLDDIVDEYSENAVQNRAIKAYVDDAAQNTFLMVMDTVPNAAIPYEETGVLTELESGEELSGALSKTKRAVGELVSHLGSNKHNKCEETGGALGEGATATTGGAIGENAMATSGFSGGANAIAMNEEGEHIDAIQLGTGTNRNERTLQVYDYTLMGADGVIPSERRPKVSGTYLGNGVSNKERTIEVGGDGKLIVITSENGMGIFSDVGGIAKRVASTSSLDACSAGVATYKNGVYTFGGSSNSIHLTLLNASGVTYYYEVL